eukprot:5502793-Amphidinium_carterae.1
MKLRSSNSGPVLLNSVINASRLIKAWSAIGRQANCLLQSLLCCTQCAYKQNVPAASRVAMKQCTTLALEAKRTIEKLVQDQSHQQAK